MTEKIEKGQEITFPYDSDVYHMPSLAEALYLYLDDFYVLRSEVKVHNTFFCIIIIRK